MVNECVNERANELTFGRQRPLEWEGLLWGLLGSVNTICMSRRNIYKLFKEIKWNSYLLRLSFFSRVMRYFCVAKFTWMEFFIYQYFQKCFFFVGRGLDDDDTYSYTVDTYIFLKFCLHNLVNR